VWNIGESWSLNKQRLGARASAKEPSNPHMEFPTSQQSGLGVIPCSLLNVICEAGRRGRKSNSFLK